MVSDLLFRMRALFRRKSLEAELDEELRSHIEHQVEKYIQSGMSIAEAKSRARFDFGDLEQVKEECRESWGVKSADQLVADVSCGLHWMSRSPGIALVTVLAIILGILANAEMFGVVNTSVSQLLPHKDTAGIALASKHLERPATHHVIKPAFVAWKVHNRTIQPSRIAGRTREARLSAGVSEPATLRATIVAAGAFRMPGIHEIRADAHASPYAEFREERIALISEVREQTAPGPDLTVLKMTLHRGEVSYTFVEVIPGNFKFSPAGAQERTTLFASGAAQSKCGNILIITMRFKTTKAAPEAISNL